MFAEVSLSRLPPPLPPTSLLPTINTRSWFIAHAGLELTNLEYWGYRHAPPNLALFFLSFYTQEVWAEEQWSPSHSPGIAAGPVTDCGWLFNKVPRFSSCLSNKKMSQNEHLGHWFFRALGSRSVQGRQKILTKFLLTTSGKCSQFRSSQCRRDR